MSYIPRPLVEKIIYSISDFPEAVGGVITLETGIEYIFTNTIVSSNRFVIPENAAIRFSSMGANVGGYVYTGSDTLYTAVDLDALEFVSALFSATSGTIFDLDTTNPNAYILINQAVFTDIDSLGTINTMAVFFQSLTFDTITTGFVFEDNSAIKISFCNHFLWNNAADTVYMTFNGTQQGQINITDLTSVPQSNESVFDFPVATTLNASASVTACGFLAAGGKLFVSGSRDQTDEKINLFASPPVSDSTTKAKLSFEDNAVDTAIDAVSVPKKVNATFDIDINERTSSTSVGTITYDGIEDIAVKVSAQIFLEPALGVAKKLAGYLAKTATEKTTVTFDNTANIVVLNAHGLSNGTSIRLINSGGALPAELFNDNFYFVINTDTNDFQVSLTLGGAAVAFTDNGTGTNSYQLGEVLHDSEYKITASANTAQTAFPTDLMDIVTGDEIEVFVENETDSNDITVLDCNFILIKV